MFYPMWIDKDQFGSFGRTDIRYSVCIIRNSETRVSEVISDK